MRTKTLLLTAALSAAGVAASMAQVYSVNVVGYVNVTVPAGKFAILANPLNNGANGINEILPMPANSDGVTVYKFDTTKQAFESYTYLNPLGWLGPQTNPSFNPGEGFFIQNITANPITFTFVGEVAQGTQSLAIPGAGKLSLRGSPFPQEIPVGPATAAGVSTMEFPAATGDTLYVYKVDTGAYVSHTYLDGLGWLSSDNTPDGPTIPVASGFWVQKLSPDATWTRTFNVN